MTIIACTGHRPNKIGGYQLPNPTYIHICQQLEKALKELQPEKIISGMALGVDSWFAYIAHKLGILFIAAVPFEGQEKAWPDKSQQTYHALLKLASEVVIVSPGGYSAQKMQIRNEWMINHCDTLIGVFKQTETNGGTYNCLQYAKSVNKDIYYIDPTLPQTI